MGGCSFEADARRLVGTGSGEACDAQRVCLAGMYSLWLKELPGRKGDPGDRTAGIEEILLEDSSAYAAQGIA